MKKNQPFEAASPPAACTTKKCTSEEDEDRLQCRKCKRYVHYECTQLPLYQLQIFVNSYNDQYTCPNCVRITRSLTNKIGDNTYHMMQRELENKDGVIQKLTKELNKLNKKSTNQETIKNELETLLTEKITHLETKTREIVREEIKQTQETIKPPTYAEMAKAQKESLKSVVKEQKEEDRKEERDIELRKPNIIIHGIMEPMKETIEKDQEEDRSEIEELLDDIDVRDIKLNHHRIGKKDEEGLKWRPIKLKLENVNEKERIMKNLHKLKKYGNRYISITDDFTINERKIIKEKCKKAKEMNFANDGDFIWRVRGSPRTSLRFAKIPRRNVPDRKTTESLSSLSDDWTDED